MRSPEIRSLFSVCLSETGATTWPPVSVLVMQYEPTQL
jgi:hypothetical protein